MINPGANGHRAPKYQILKAAQIHYNRISLRTKQDMILFEYVAICYGLNIGIFEHQTACYRALLNFTKFN